MLIAIFLLLAGLQGPPPTPSLLTLDDAVARALELNPSLRAERADARAAAQLPLQATRGFLPTVSLDLTGMRTTDPVAVFGLKLRQGSFGPADFDFGALNDPTAFGGFTASATVQQPILAPEGLFGYAAARRGAAAMSARADRMAGATRFLVTRAYWNAQLARLRVFALDTALIAARAHEARAEAMREQGLVTGLDARLARIRAAAVEVEQLAARADAANALAALTTMLALPDSVDVVLADSLVEPREAECLDSEQCAVSERADLAAHRLGTEAAALDVKRAWASQLPALAAFGTIQQHAHDAPFGTGSGDWTVGIGLTWRPLQALAGVGAVREAQARRDAAAARLEAAEEQAQLEVSSARRSVDAAAARVEVAAQAVQESRAARDQAALRYRTGSAPITELLDVETATTNAQLNLLGARRDLLVAQAALDFAYGAYDR